MEVDIRRPDSVGLIGVDLPCLHCGYNLRTRHTAAACPECGHPVLDTHRAFAAEPLLSSRLRRLHRAWRLLTIAHFLPCGLVLLALLTLASPPLAASGGLVLLCLWGLMTLTGSLMAIGVQACDWHPWTGSSASIGLLAVVLGTLTTLWGFLAKDLEALTITVACYGCVQMVLGRRVRLWRDALHLRGQTLLHWWLFAYGVAMIAWTLGAMLRVGFGIEIALLLLLTWLMSSIPMFRWLRLVSDKARGYTAAEEQSFQRYGASTQ